MTEAMQDLQKKAVNELFEKMKGNDKELTFKAPTGSGKTYMMSALMDKILSEDENVVFLVSTLSKGGLAEQNFKAFERFGREKFANLKPFLIESKDEKSEGMVEIARGFNVYVLARDLFGEKRVLKTQGVLVNFLNDITGNVLDENQICKKVYLIKDECHQATNNLDELDKKRGFFSKVLNISATPKQIPSVKIETTEAESVNLIKKVEWHEEETNINEILAEFERIRNEYVAYEIGVRPCLIIQISNQSKAEGEIKELKEAILQRAALKYMIILDESNAKKCETNDELGKSNLSIKKWKNYAKENQSSIDIIIFKMVISEGWDIPRACMLYQVRDSKSKQLNEQVIGRVRRNPRLTDYELLSKEQQDVINRAYVYGLRLENEENSAIEVKLKGEIHKGLFANEIINEFKITITRLDRNKAERLNFDAQRVLEKCTEQGKDDFFALFNKLEKAKISHLCKEYAENDSLKWFDFANNAATLKKEFEKIVTNYDESISTKDENKVELKGHLALESFFIKNDKKAMNLKQWIWDLKTQDRYDDSKKFTFDSEAEREFAFVISQILDKSVKQINLFDDKKIYLFGKNYPYSSEIKFEYYLDGYHFSYPDFILKDKQERIHIFEIKSLNSMNSSTFNGAELQNLKDDDLARLGGYERKIVELGRVYKALSARAEISYFFWLAIKQTNEKWLLHCFKDGKNLYNGELFNEREFENELQKRLVEVV